MRKDITKEILLEKYIQQRKSLSVVAKECKTTASTILEKLKIYNIPIRSKSSARIKDIVGKRYGRLTVKSFSHISETSKASYWNCACDCGNESQVQYTNLKTTKSCGCLSIEAGKKWGKINGEKCYKGGKYLTATEFSSYKTGAKIRNLEFSISIEDVEKVYKQQNFKCKLSGRYLVFNTRISTGDESKRGQNKIIRGDASIDRIDSSKGYTVDNIQIIHKDINVAKQAKSDEDFIKMCCEVADHARNRG